MSSFDLELHVSPTGAPAGAGTLADPLDSIEHARDLLRTIREPQQTAAIRLAPGRYPITRPIAFSTQDSHLMVSGGGGTVSVDGGVVLDDWSATTENGTTMWTAPAPGRGVIRSLFVDGVRANRPRFPRGTSLQIADQPGLDLHRSGIESLFEGTHTFRTAPGDIRQHRDLEQIEVIVPHYWVQERMPVVSFDPATRTISSNRKSIFALRDDVVGEFASYWLENVYESLGEIEGEWYHDSRNGRILYVPRADDELDTFSAVVPLVDQLMLVHGTADEPAFDISFENLTFVHTDWVHPDATDFGDHERLSPDTAYASAPQAAIDARAAIELQHARRCSVTNCVVEHVGGYGIDLRHGVANALLRCNTLRDLGAGGIMISGATALGLPGVTRGNTLTDNEITSGGHIFPAGIGVLIRHSRGNTISHNHIHDLHYSGISCGWVWGYADSISGDNRLEGNHIHDIGHGLLSDMGGIYVLGVQAGTVLAHNLIHDIKCANYGGWCIYLDEGSSHVLVEDNVCHGAATQAFHQHYGRENVVRNNLFAFGARGQIATGRVESHLSYTFERNVVVGAGRPAYIGGTGGADPRELRILSDLNLVWDVDQPATFAGIGRADAVEPNGRIAAISTDEWHSLGHDLHSRLADPGLTLPLPTTAAMVNIRGEAATELGIRSIDLTDVGPRG